MIDVYREMAKKTKVFCTGCRHLKQLRGPGSTRLEWSYLHLEWSCLHSKSQRGPLGNHWLKAEYVNRDNNCPDFERRPVVPALKVPWYTRLRKWWNNGK